MYSTKIYLYNQDLVGLFLDTDDIDNDYNLARTKFVYSKILKATKGVDTIIDFQFYNQDQKPVNLDQATLTFKLIDASDNSVLLSKSMPVTVPAKGKSRLTLTSSDLTDIDSQRAEFVVQRVWNSRTELAYIDDNAGTHGVIDILPALA